MTEAAGSFRGRVHRGTQQIGGTCIELEAAGERILLDLGLPLDADGASDDLLPAVSRASRRRSNPECDRPVARTRRPLGSAPLCKPDVPLAMGAATARIMCAAAPFVPNAFVPNVSFELSDRRALQIGPFSITPYLVDHSAYDAYALLIQAGGRRLFYSGDIRAHGRKGGLFERLVSHPPRDIDTMLMEGSSLGRLDEHAQFPTEDGHRGKAGREF